MVTLSWHAPAQRARHEPAGPVHAPFALQQHKTTRTLETQAVSAPDHIPLSHSIHPTPFLPVVCCLNLSPGPVPPHLCLFSNLQAPQPGPTADFRQAGPRCTGAPPFRSFPPRRPTNQKNTIQSTSKNSTPVCACPPSRCPPVGRLADSDRRRPGGTILARLRFFPAQQPCLCPFITCLVSPESTPPKHPTPHLHFS